MSIVTLWCHKLCCVLLEFP